MNKIKIFAKTLLVLVMMMLCSMMVMAVDDVFTQDNAVLVSNTDYCYEDCSLEIEVSQNEADRLMGKDSNEIDYKVINLDSKAKPVSDVQWQKHELVTYGKTTNSEERVYSCKHDVRVFEDKAQCYYTYLNKTKNEEVIVWSNGYTKIKDSDIHYDYETTNKIKYVNYEWVGSTDKVKNLRVYFDGVQFHGNFDNTKNKELWKKGETHKIKVTGSLKELGSAIDIIPSMFGLDITKFAVWNSTDFIGVATPNVSGTTDNSGQVLWLKGCNCSSEFSNGNITCTDDMKSNASCYYNMCTELMGASEDCSDIQVFDSDTNTTVLFTPLVNVTGASWLGNSTALVDDGLLWDGILIHSPFWNQSVSLSSNIKVGTTGTRTGSTNEGVNTDLVGYWIFEPGINESSSKDISGSGNDGIVTEALFVQDGNCTHGNGQNSNGCYYFDGSVDRVEVGTGFSFQPGQPFSIDAWVSTAGADVLNDKMIFSWSKPTSEFWGYTLAYRSSGTDRILFGAIGDDYPTDFYDSSFNYGLVQGASYHIVLNFDGVNQSYLFINGTPVTRTSSSGNYAGAFSLTINASVGWRYGTNSQSWLGYIPEIKVYNRTLSDEEINGSNSMTKHVNNYWGYESFNSAPSSATGLIPDGGEEYVVTPVIISWTAGVDADNDTLIYYIYGSTDGVVYSFIENTTGLTSSWTPSEDTTSGKILVVTGDGLLNASSNLTTTTVFSYRSEYSAEETRDRSLSGLITIMIIISLVIGGLMFFITKSKTDDAKKVIGVIVGGMVIILILMVLGFMSTFF